MYAYDAGKKAIQSHYERVGIQANVEHMERLGDDITQNTR